VERQHLQVEKLKRLSLLKARKLGLHQLTLLQLSWCLLLEAVVVVAMGHTPERLVVAEV
jgi:hypothetical protein